MLIVFNKLELASWISFWFSGFFKSSDWFDALTPPPYNLHTYLQFVPFDLLSNKNESGTINSDLPICTTNVYKYLTYLNVKFIYFSSNFRSFKQLSMSQQVLPIKTKFRIWILQVKISLPIINNNSSDVSKFNRVYYYVSWSFL